MGHDPGGSNTDWYNLLIPMYMYVVTLTGITYVCSSIIVEH